MTVCIILRNKKFEVTFCSQVKAFLRSEVGLNVATYKQSAIRFMLDNYARIILNLLGIPLSVPATQPKPHTVLSSLDFWL